METLLLAFSLIAESDIEQMGDHEAISKLHTFLKRLDIKIIVTKNGPMFHALLKWFGLIAPYTGQQRLDQLDPVLVCKTLLEFEKLKHKIVKMNQQQNFKTKNCFGDGTNSQPTQSPKQYNEVLNE